MKPLRLRVVEDNPDDEARVSNALKSGPGRPVQVARAEAHGGRAGAETREGGGARFTLELPLEKEERA